MSSQSLSQSPSQQQNDTPTAATPQAAYKLFTAQKRSRSTSEGTPTSKKYTFEEAVKRHPFHDLDDYEIVVRGEATFVDARGKVVCSVIRNAYPEEVAKSAELLKAAATRTSLRSTMFGGESPRSGIAGYFDYFGSPIEYKCRKTSFTDEHIKAWPNVFPLVEYVNTAYKKAAPKNWSAQNAAIPDLVRIRGSAFSTLTINERFRTASHTDAGDYDGGLGCITVLSGNYSGLHLGFPDFGVCVDLRPRDVMLFDTHYFHCNTEAEVEESMWESWSRISVVFYYRANLGGSTCAQNYQRRIAELPEGVEHVAYTPTDNGTNLNRPEEVHKDVNSPATILLCWARRQDNSGKLLTTMYYLHDFFLDNTSAWSFNVPALPPRDPAHIIPQKELLDAPASVPGTGFSEAQFGEDSPDVLASVLKEEGVVPAALVTMWQESRAAWLQRVRLDWRQQTLRTPDRGNFTWANKGEVNRTFFDLCDVAVGIMKNLAKMEDVTTQQKASFYGSLAVHLFRACVDELKMPHTAMTIKKLNTKLKDYDFGGTRYLKDYPAEEQERRRARQKRIEAARRVLEELSDDGSKKDEHETNWLLKDAYDYQTEDAEVDYEALGCPDPEHYFAKAMLEADTTPLQALKMRSPKKGSVLRIAIVEPEPTAGNHEPQLPTTEARDEYDRLMGTYKKQHAQEPQPRWRNTNHAEVTRVTVKEVLGKQGDIGADVVIVMWALHLVDESLARVLARRNGCPVFFMVHNGVDPRHFLVRRPQRVAFEAAISQAIESALGPRHAEINVKSVDEWCDALRGCGFDVAGSYRVRGSALCDTFIACVPKAPIIATTGH